MKHQKSTPSLAHLQNPIGTTESRKLLTQLGQMNIKESLTSRGTVSTNNYKTATNTDLPQLHSSRTLVNMQQVKQSPYKIPILKGMEKTLAPLKFKKSIAEQGSMSQREPPRTTFASPQRSIAPSQGIIDPLKYQTQVPASTTASPFPFPNTHLPALKHLQKRSVSNIAKLTQKQNRALDCEFQTLDNYHTEQHRQMTGQKALGKMDPEKLMQETDRGFKILTARLNRVVNSQGSMKMDAQQEYTIDIKPNCGVYCHINTFQREQPLYFYIKKKKDFQNCVVYYSKLQKCPDFENNQGSSTNQRLVITDAVGDNNFSSEHLFLGLFSQTGGSFQVIHSFKNEIAFKQQGSPNKEGKKKKKEQEKNLLRHPLDFLYNEVEADEQAERKKNHQLYFKNKVNAIISDEYVLKEFLKKMRALKDKRSQDYTSNKLSTSKDSHTKQFVRMISLNQIDTSQQSFNLLGTTFQDSKLNSTRLDLKLAQAFDRKLKLDEDNYKRKLFLLNKREYLSVLKKKQAESLSQLKRSKQRVRFWLTLGQLGGLLGVLDRKIKDVKYEKQTMKKKFFSIVRIMKNLRKHFVKRGPKIEERFRKQLKQSFAFQAQNSYDTAEARSKPIILAFLRQSAQDYYMKQKFQIFYHLICRAQTLIKGAVERKRLRLGNLMGQFKDYVCNLEIMNGYVHSEVETSPVSRKNLNKKVLVIFDRWHDNISKETIKTHLRYSLLTKECEFMLEYIRWSILYQKTMLNPQLIIKLREGLVRLKSKDQELDALTVKHIQYKDLTSLIKPQNLTPFQNQKHLHLDSDLLDSQESSRPNQGFGGFSSLWKNIPSLKFLENEDLLGEISELLGVSKEEIRHISNAPPPRPRMRIRQTNEEMWQVFVRVYTLGVTDLATN